MNVAPRIEHGQAWWCGSELVRRHPELTLRGDDHLTYLTLLDRRGGETLAGINPSTIHIPGRKNQGEYSSLTGPEGVLAAHNTREFIRKVERAIGISSPDRAPSTQPHSLVFRLVSALLASQVNDKHTWDCRSEVASEDFGPFSRGWVDRFGATVDTRSVQLEGWEAGLEERHFWGITRGDEPVALLSVEGVLYRTKARFDLNAEYARAGRRLLPVLTATLGDLLG